MGERLAGTKPVTAPAPLVGDEEQLTLGGTRVELRYLGDAYSPGDAVVWLPEQQVLFSGDLVYTDRLLGALPSSSVCSWQAAFHRMEALMPAVIIPGLAPIPSLTNTMHEKAPLSIPTPTESVSGLCLGN